MTVRPVKIQSSLGIPPVWSESLLCAQWVAKNPSFLHTDSKDSDQTGQMPRLIWVFTRRHFVGFVTRWLNLHAQGRIQVFLIRGSYLLSGVQFDKFAQLFLKFQWKRNNLDSKGVRANPLNPLWISTDASGKYATRGRLWHVFSITTGAVSRRLGQRGESRSAHYLFCLQTFEPCHAKTCLWGFRPGKTQTSLLYHRG